MTLDQFLKEKNDVYSDGADLIDTLAECGIVLTDDEYSDFLYDYCECHDDGCISVNTKKMQARKK